MITGSKNQRTTTLGIINLLFFGGGGIVYFILNKKSISNRLRNITLLIGCLIFIISSYYLLPFHHLFDNNRKYHPTIGWIIGIIGMLFFGYGFIISIIKLVKDDKT